MRHRNITLASLILLGLFMVYFIFRPKYQLTHYKLNNCKNLYLTKIEYNKILGRGVAFAYGKVEKESLPLNECLVDDYLGGIDSHYSVEVYCKDGIITIYSFGSYLKPIGKCEKIKYASPYTNDYDKNIKSLNNLKIDGE